MNNDKQTNTSGEDGYCVVTATCAVDLMKKVNAQMVEKWQPLGGPFTDNCSIFYQAMTK